MKFVTFDRQDSTRIGVLTDEGVLDLSTCGIELPDDMLSLIELREEGLDRVRKAIDKGGEIVSMDEVRLRQPVIRPPKILAIALNYAEHIAESATQKPAVQMWFNKQSTCANGPYDPIALPVASDKLDYEGELGIIIGKRCRHVPKERAHEVIYGYTVVNDVSVRDWQRAAQTFQIGKSFDTHGPFGPYIVTPDEVGDPQDLDLKTIVNGEVRQDSNTKHMIYKIDEQIAHLTTAFTLEPGDLLVTGTPSGVGAAMDPPSFLKEGDVVRVEIEKVGAIENPVQREDGTPRIL
jgi:2-keto-4-pentenoate hydratase/2-oxohepta-3-ene-1,7-dioic acid hydratase in catechol pathway